MLNKSQRGAPREFPAGRTLCAALRRGLAPGGSYTVRRCVEDYLHFLEANRKSGRDTRYRARALIPPALGDIPCAELTHSGAAVWSFWSASHPVGHSTLIDEQVGDAGPRKPRSFQGVAALAASDPCRTEDRKKRRRGSASAGL